VITRIKAAVLVQFFLYWLAIVVIAIADRQLFRQLGLASGAAASIALVVALTALLALLTYGVIRGWRWIFWLILLAFLAGALRVPAALLELAGRLLAAGPAWYVLFTAVVGLVQFASGVAMVAGYRKAGAWGDF